MDRELKEDFLNKLQKYLLLLFLLVLISCILIFKDIFFESSILIKNLGKKSLSPEIAFVNKKPTFIEFYAEWCEVCKEMAPNINELKKEFDNDINFVFLNVDNAKWQDYIEEYNVNGIPQINLLNKDNNLEATFVGKQGETNMRESLNALLNDQSKIESFVTSDLSPINKNQVRNNNPRSHG